MSIYVSSIEVTGDLRESIIWRVEEMSVVDSWVGSKLERRLSTHRVVLVKESRLTLPPLCLTALSSLPTVPGLFPQLSTATDNWERLTAPSFTLVTLPFSWAGQAGLGLRFPLGQHHLCSPQGPI